MHRRLYFILPNVSEAKKIVNELLLNRICIHHIHFLANEDINLGDLPEANLFQKYDITHSIFLGLGLGAIIGVFIAMIATYNLDLQWGGNLVFITIVSAFLGAWCSSMIGIMVPNRHLKNFDREIEEGKILLMIDVPKEKRAEIKNLITGTHPQVYFAGIEPTIPGFP
jgi:hypothetical protein